LTDALSISPLPAFHANVRPPGSKSLTNRALLLAALASGPCTLRDPLVTADDAQRMLGALKQLGFELKHDQANNVLSIQGKGGHFPPVTNNPLFLGNAGTAYRFLTAACCLGQGEYELTGIPRMHERPIGQLVEALHEIGAQIAFLKTPGFPPLKITGSQNNSAAHQQLTGGELVMPPTLSSQYISALLQIGPYCKKGLTIRFKGEVTSRPYVTMTVQLMQLFGADVTIENDYSAVHVKPGSYQPTQYAVEPDASNASYFLAAAAMIPGSQCTIEGLGKRSIQGDVGFADVLHQMGAGLTFGSDFITVIAPPDGKQLRGIDIDLNHMPDMAQTLAAVALFAQGPTVIRNVGNLRVKETDRMAALRNELVKLGAGVEIDGDDLHIEPPLDNKITPAAIDTYDDHRMAMSFALVGLRAKGVVINDPTCVNKTFPEYFDYLAKLADSPAPDSQTKIS
jgi:3-phosphoshikimate 1-carboxyvinyltransferase